MLEEDASIEVPLKMLPSLVTKRSEDKQQARRTNHHQHPSPELQIFTIISKSFGRAPLKIARRWETFAIRHSSTKEQLFFLHECIRKQILPKSVRYRPPINHPQAWKLAFKNGCRMLQFMITDAHNRLKKYQDIIDQQKISCTKTIGEELTAILEQAINRTSNNFRTRKHENLQRKLTRIIPHAQEESSNTWIKNLSSKRLSRDEENLLTRGLHFNHKNANPIDFLAKFEAILKSNNLNQETQNEIRQKLIPNIYRKNNQRMLSRNEEKALRKLQDDKSIVLLPADKGRLTVIMDKTDYIQKADQLLEDKNTYRCIDNDPTKQLENKIIHTLKKMENEHRLTSTTRKRMQPQDSTIPRFYGLPKVHKDGIPLRPIVSLPGAPTYKLAKELRRNLQHLINGSDHSINSSEQFLQKIKHTSIDQDEIMVSFDVTALFTSIDLELAKQTIHNLLVENQDTNNPTTGTNPSNNTIMELLELCLTTHFKFNGKIYQQIKGTPMGSPISGLIAEAVMQRLEKIVLPIIRPKLWIRYVDDTFVIMKRSEVEESHRLLNNVFNGITFTREQEKDGHLPFLDVDVRRSSNTQLETTVYRKPTHTDQILNFASNHPMSHKRSCVLTLFKRAKTHCSTNSLRKAEEKHIFNQLIRNGYPKNFILRCIFSKTQTNEQETTTTAATYQSLPYIKGVSEMAARILQPHGIKIAHKPAMTLRNTLTRIKDQLEKDEKSNVIYRINCKNCEKFYVGQTGRLLKTRIHEHQLAVKRHEQKSLISIHADAEGHDFDWDNVKIVGQAGTRHAREFLEAWHSTNGSINRHIEIEVIYEPLRNRVTHRKQQGPRNRNFDLDPNSTTPDACIATTSSRVNPPPLALTHFKRRITTPFNHQYKQTNAGRGCFNRSSAEDVT